MKKKITVLFLTAVLLGLSALNVLADSYTSYTRVVSIPSVKVKIATGELQAGDVLSDDAASYVGLEDNQYYVLQSAEWLDSTQNLKVGDQPRMKIYLNAIPRQTDYEKYTKIWLFQGSYTQSNVSVSGADFISTGIRDSGYTLELTVRIKAIRGTYEAPSSVYWDSELGRGKWTAASNDSGVYDIILYRGALEVKKLESYTGNYYNFYPYMTKAGDYSFKVRTVPASGVTGGKNSEYVYSPNLTIKENQVSDGSGQTTTDEKGGSSGHNTGNNSYPNGTGTENVAGWVTDSTGTYFRYPSGEYAKNGWLKVNGNWYLLDSTGKRLTGWQQNPSGTNWFYMDPTTGIMKTGWLKLDNYWYYLEPEGDSCGKRISGWRDIGGKRYYFNDNGIMVTGWFSINGKWYYFYPEGARSDGYGYMATNTKIGDFNIGGDGTWQN